MRVGELLDRIDRAGVTLSYFAEDRLNAKPASALTPGLIEALKLHKQQIIQIMREDEELRETGIIQSERQVFNLAHEYVGRGEKRGKRGRVTQPS
jgi:TubC N-terminal docking domain